MVADVSIGEVLKVVPEIADRSGGIDRLVDPAGPPPRAAAIVKAQLRIRIPVGRAEPAAEVLCHPWNAVAGGIRVGKGSGDFARQIGRDSFVGIHRQHPVELSLGSREVLLRGIAGPLVNDDPRP